MILLFGVFLLLIPAETRFFNSLKPHLVENLKLKCDALPYRTILEGTRCYFAIFKEVPYSVAQSQCSTVLKDSKLALEDVDAILKGLMTDTSKFHNSAKSSDAKHTLCVYDSSYKCGKGQFMTGGKCATRAEKKMNFVDAQKSCKKLGMELFSPANDFDNQQISGKYPRKSLDSRGSKFVWNAGKSYSRYGTCDGKSKKPSLYSASQSATCSAALASVVEKSGYWSNTEQKNEMNTICTKSAENDFTPIAVVKKPVFDAEGPCVEQHELDESTGRCEWTGPVDACVQLLDYWNHSHFIKMKRFPTFLQTEECLRTTRNEMDDYTVKAIVRRGCMVTGYAYPATGDANAEIKVVENLVYGAHKIPNYMNQGVGLYHQGLSRIHCFCDPTEATVSGNIPAPPTDQKCIDYHDFNETTQQCEWKLDTKFCAELRTSDNRKQLLQIPNWPAKRKYDLNHWDHKRNENFHVTVTNIIVRQHCFASAYFWAPFHTWKTLPTMGYGHHTVASQENQLTRGPGNNEGSVRFVCECIR